MKKKAAKHKALTPSERQVKDSILEHFGLRTDMVLFTNSVGLAIYDRYVVPYGLCVGASDLIGWITIDGKAVFLALEVKDHKGKASDEQLNFIQRVNLAGGIAGVVRSVADVYQLIDDYKARVAA